MRQSHINYTLIIILVISILLSVCPVYSVSADDLDKSQIAPGDILYYGKCRQTDLSGDSKTPIPWVVLERNKNKVTLISLNILEYDYYEFTAIETDFWPDSHMRESLCEAFYNSAFNKNEQQAIVPVQHQTKIPGTNKTLKSNDTVYLLDIAEAYYYFDISDEKGKTSSYKFVNDTKQYRQAAPTPYAQKIYFSIWGEGQKDVPSKQWLRCICSDKLHAAAISNSGSISEEETTLLYGIRPVIMIDLNKVVDGTLSTHLPISDVNPVSFLDPMPTKEFYEFDISIDYKANIIFSKYPINIYLDDEPLGIIENGNSLSQKQTVGYGKHTISFYKEDDKNICNSVTYTIEDDSSLKLSVKAKRNTINIEYEKFDSRYFMEDKTMVKYLKEYDTIMYNLKKYYNTAWRYRKRVRKKTPSYDNTYFLFGENKGVFYFKDPYYQYDSNAPVEHYKGVYEGNLSAGNITVTLENGAVYKFENHKSIKESDSLIDAIYTSYSFNAACDEAIIEVFPEVYKKLSDVMYYLRKTDKEKYKRLFPNGP